MSFDVFLESKLLLDVDILSVGDVFSDQRRTLLSIRFEREQSAGFRRTFTLNSVRNHRSGVYYTRE